MNDINQVTLSGTVRRPEMRYSQSGSPWGTFTVITHSTTKDGKEYKSFIDCKAFGASAEQVGQLQEGDRVVVGGKIESSSRGEGDDKKWYTGVTVLSIVPVTSAASPAAPISPDDIPF